METDQIHMETDSDIHILIPFQFPSPKMETDRIHMETDLDISDICFPICLPFPFLEASWWSFLNHADIRG